MTGIRWFKSGKGVYAHYIAKIGSIELACRPRLNWAPKEYDEPVAKPIIVGWKYFLYVENKLVVDTKTIRAHKQDEVDLALKLCQENAEKIAIKYLFGYGSVTLKALKKVGLLEEILESI